MVLKSQIAEMRKLKAICLFAPHESDRQYSQKIKSHFYYFEKLYLEEIDCWELSKKNALDLGILLEKVDIVFLITSMELVKALENNYSIKAKLRNVSTLGKTQVLGIKVAPFITKMSFISRLPQFPQNSYLEDPKWEHLNSALEEIHDEIEHCIKGEQARQDQIEKEWHYAQLWDTREVYARFCKTYKYSEYYEEAKSRKEALTEAKLWNIVQRVGNTRAYFMYLQYSENLSKLDEVSIKMAEILESEDLAKAEVRKFDDLFLTYHVDNKFPRKGKDEKLDVIDEYWKRTVTNIQPSLASITTNNRSKRFKQMRTLKQLNANFLDYQASIMLNNDEQAVYFEFAKNVKNLKRNLAIQKIRWTNELANCKVYFIGLIVLTALCFFTWMDYSLLWGGLLLGGYLAYLQMVSGIRNYITFTSLAQNYVRLQFPIIKSAILLHDENLRLKQGKHFPQIERDLTQIKHRKWSEIIGTNQMIDYTYLIPIEIAVA